VGSAVKAVAVPRHRRQQFRAIGGTISAPSAADLATGTTTDYTEHTERPFMPRIARISRRTPCVAFDLGAVRCRSVHSAAKAVAVPRHRRQQLRAICRSSSAPSAAKVPRHLRQRFRAIGGTSSAAIGGTRH
jgi:hypothetical protein